MKFCQLLTYPEAHLRGLDAMPARSQESSSYKDLAEELAANPSEATTSWVPSLTDAGHNARLIVANDTLSQQRWQAEKLSDFKPGAPESWMREIVIEQLRKFKVDVLCIFDPWTFDSSFIKALKGRPSWVVGHAASLSSVQADWSGFDLVLTPHEACVRQARQRGAREARLFPSGFPRAMAEAVFQVPVTLDVVYCGRWLPGEVKRNGMITALAENALRRERPFSLGLHLEVPEGVDLPSAVAELNRGPVYGIERCRALHRAAICVAEEPDIELGRTMPSSVFESTGTGVFTLVEENDLLPGFFKPGAELVMYQGTPDLVSKIEAFLAAHDNRSAIAKAGQERCLTEHSMEARMGAFVRLVEHPPGGRATAARRWFRGHSSSRHG